MSWNIPFRRGRVVIGDNGPVTRRSDKDSKGEKMTGTDEAFPYELMSLESNVRSGQGHVRSGQVHVR